MSRFCDFEKKMTLRFHRIFLLFDKNNPLIFFFHMCFILRCTTIAYQCPNMIHFDVVDSKERRSEEVIFP